MKVIIKPPLNISFSLENSLIRKKIKTLTVKCIILLYLILYLRIKLIDIQNSLFPKVHLKMRELISIYKLHLNF